MIAPASDDLLEAYEVSTAVNRTANDDPKLVERNFEPVGAQAIEPTTVRPQAKRTKKDDGQGVLF